MDKELLTVIVPVYNVEKYLSKCIESIERQTYKQLEIILVDDGSTDSSKNICDAFAAKDARIKVIHKENGGLISARYTGLMHATADYIAFVDSDDWIMCEMYDELMAIMLREKVDLVTSGCIRYWDEDDWFVSIDKLIDSQFYDKKQVKDKIVPKMLWCKELDGWALDPSLCTKIFKKEILQKIYYSLRKETFYFGEDTAVIYPFMLEANSVYATNNTFYYHRRRKRNTASTFIGEESFFEQLYQLYLYLKRIFIQSDCKDIMLHQLDHFYMKSVCLKKRIYGNDEPVTYKYLFPFDKVTKGSQIVLYGAGKVGHQYFDQIKCLGYCDIVMWVDKNYLDYSEDDIVSVSSIKQVNYDYIVIANASESTVEIIKKELNLIDVLDEKIVTAFA